MTHLLHLDASPRGDRSVSRMLGKEYIDQWMTAHLSDRAQSEFRLTNQSQTSLYKSASPVKVT
jgi:FMN-dependent NADH-azoreductase